jgi:hypothetical protein
MPPDDNITEIGQGYHAVYHNVQVWRAYGYGVVSGGQVTPGSDGVVSVDVSAGTAVHNGDVESIPATSSLSLASPDATDPRKDLVVYTGGGTVTTVTGTPNAIDDAQDTASRFETYTPSPPDGTGLADPPVVLAEVWVAADSSTIEAADINDLRTDPAIQTSTVTADDVTVRDKIDGASGVVSGDLTDFEGDGLTLAGSSLAAALATSGGLKIESGGIAVEPADVAGTLLDDDGSDNLAVDESNIDHDEIDQATVSPDDHHAQDHQSRHGLGGDDELATALRYKPEQEPSTPDTGVVRWYDQGTDAFKVKFDDGAVVTVAEK